MRGMLQVILWLCSCLSENTVDHRAFDGVLLASSFLSLALPPAVGSMSSVRMTFLFLKTFTLVALRHDETHRRPDHRNDPSVP